MTVWLVLLSVAAGSYLLRASMFLVLGDRGLPSWAERPMSFVGPAAMTALVASLVMTSGGRPVVPEPAVAAAVVAGAIAVRRSGNVLHAFVVGLPVFWLVTALVR